jgi:hypothetical protein
MLMAVVLTYKQFFLLPDNSPTLWKTSNCEIFASRSHQHHHHHLSAHEELHDARGGEGAETQEGSCSFPHRSGFSKM